MTQSTKPLAQLSISRRFDVPVEALYAAWTDVDQLKAWHCPVEYRVTEASADVRTGGHYRIGMQPSDPDKAISVVVGSYQEVIPNQKLVYTWQWEHSCEGESTPETLVTLTFTALSSEQSALELKHERFPDDDMRNKHNEGWCSCLDHLGSQF